MLLTLLLLATTLQDPVAGTAADTAPVVVVVPFEGRLSESLVALTVRGLRRAGELDAEAIVFEIDTPGGEITQALFMD